MILDDNELSIPRLINVWIDWLAGRTRGSRHSACASSRSWRALVIKVVVEVGRIRGPVVVDEVAVPKGGVRILTFMVVSDSETWDEGRRLDPISLIVAAAEEPAISDSEDCTAAV